MSEAGVHRPHVGGIHGRSNDGAYSLVLAGGFEDEVVSNVMTLFFRTVLIILTVLLLCPKYITYYCLFFSLVLLK